MIKKLWIVMLALAVVTVLTGISYAEQSTTQGGQAGTTAGEQTGAAPGGQAGTTAGEQTGARGGVETLSGTVRDINVSNKTVRVTLDQNYGPKRKGEEVTFKVLDQTRWEGTQWRSLSDLKPGDHVRFEVQASPGKDEILAFRSMSGAAGEEQGRGAGQPGTSEQPQPGTSEQGQPETSEQSQPGTSEQGQPETSEQSQPGTSEQGQPGTSGQSNQ